MLIHDEKVHLWFVKLLLQSRMSDIERFDQAPLSSFVKLQLNRFNLFQLYIESLDWIGLPTLYISVTLYFSPLSGRI